MRCFALALLLVSCGGPTGPYTEIIYQIEGGSDADLQKAVEVLNRRFSRSDLKQAKVVAASGKIEVRIYETDRVAVANYKRLIESPAKLEFRELGNQIEHRAAKEAGWKETGGLLLRKNPEPRDPPSVVSHEYVLLCDPAVITGEHVTVASTEGRASHQGLTWEIRFKLNEEGTKRFLDSTTKLSKSKPQGHIAILLNDRVLSIPVVAGPINGEGVVHGSFSEDEAKTLALVLGAGALPKPLKPVSERDVPGK